MNVKNLKNEIQLMMSLLDFPKEAADSLTADAKKLMSYPEATARFLEAVGQYDESVEIDYTAALSLMKELAALTGIHEYAMNLLYFLSLCPKLRERYIERGLSDKLFVDTMKDLAFKANESHTVYGVWGTFVPAWYPRFFYGFDRFFFTRLQLEPVALKYDCTVNGREYKAGAKALNVHIPNTGKPLYHDEVIKSYHEAVEFFKDYFGEDDVLIVCNSWLLNPQHDSILKPGSNMLLFAHDYTLAYIGYYADNNSLWRTFDRPFTGDIGALPTDTTLRRAYVDMLKKGEQLAYGYGVIVYEDFAKKYPKI